MFNERAAVAGATANGDPNKQMLPSWKSNTESQEINITLFL